MAKVFAENKGKSPRPLRNGYDHSFQNLLTGDYGYIYPINVEELNPGESIRINDTVSVRSHPVVFPVQTRIKAYVHYFAVRNRILLDDWENFISGLDPNAQLPFLKWSESLGKRLLKTGSLMDYLGVPTTVAGDFANVVLQSSPDFIFPTSFKSASAAFSTVTDALYKSFLGSVSYDALIHSQLSASNLLSGFGYHMDLTKLRLSSLPSYIRSSEIFDYTPSSPSVSQFYISLVVGDSIVLTESCNIVGSTSDSYFYINIPDSIKSKYVELDPLSNGLTSGFIVSLLLSGSVTDIANVASSSAAVIRRLIGDYRYFLDPVIYNDGLPSVPLDFFVGSSSQRVIDAVDDRVISGNRFLSHSGNDPVEPLSALYPRAYEMIYNYYYRNSQNNPYNPTGSKVEYNKFIPTDESGWDTNEYVLRRRNWELDPYTSAVPSPQFGDAPLIGITYTGGDTADFTFEVQDEQQNTVKVKAKMRVDPDTGVLSGVQSFDENVPSGNIRNLMDLSTYGISINAIRNANAFQLFKEDTLQHPLRYRDQIYAHFGVNVDYPDVDVPEFIGGTSADLVVSQVTNMSESDNAPLGDIAGKIDAVFQFKHPVKYHAKEHTIIIGVISLVPVPCYSQLLPKRFSRVSMFDFYQRRFGKIGYVPIFRRELFPLQSQDPDDVFGYQRAWYEYMSRQNEIHGDFRTSLSDFVITRVFKDEPQLNENFTVVDPESVTNIFATDGIQDKYGSSNKFMIQVYHDTSYISIIPKHGRASLE